MGVKVSVKFDEKKLKNAIKEKATTTLNNRIYGVACPFCKSKIDIPSGKSICPYCRKEVDLQLNIKFK